MVDDLPDRVPVRAAEGGRIEHGRQRAVMTKDKIAARLVPRRGLDEVEAALYLSLSPSKFRQMVIEGTMPRPRLAGRRRIWDVDELDLAFKALPREGGEDALFGASGGDSWADYQ